MLQQCSLYYYKRMGAPAIIACLFKLWEKLEKNSRSGSVSPSCLTWDKSTHLSGFSPLLIEVVKQEKSMEFFSPHVLGFWSPGYEFIMEWI